MLWHLAWGSCSLRILMLNEQKAINSELTSWRWEHGHEVDHGYTVERDLQGYKWTPSLWFHTNIVSTLFNSPGSIFLLNKSVLIATGLKGHWKHQQRNYMLSLLPNTCEIQLLTLKFLPMALNCSYFRRPQKFPQTALISILCFIRGKKNFSMKTHYPSLDHGEACCFTGT